MHQVINAQSASWSLRIAELAGTGTKMVPELPLLRRLMWVRLVMMDRQRFEGGASAGLGDIARLDDRALELVAKIRGKSGHRVPHEEVLLDRLADPQSHGVTYPGARNPLSNKLMTIYWAARMAFQLHGATYLNARNRAKRNDSLLGWGGL
jgi:hypothetical protein